MGMILAKLPPDVIPFSVPDSSAKVKLGYVKVCMVEKFLGSFELPFSLYFICTPSYF
jgi:hypothetical protein